MAAVYFLAYRGKSPLSRLIRFFTTCLTSSTREDKERWFCSEIAYAACLAAGAKLLNEERPAKVTPRIFCLSPYLKRVGSFVAGGVG